MQDTARKVKEMVNNLYHLRYNDLMSHKWLTTDLKQPRIPEFYTQTKIRPRKHQSAEQSFLGAVV